MQVLIYSPSYARIERALHERLPSVKPVVMAADGTFTLDGAPITIEDARPAAAWANSDVYNGPARDFMVACLRSPTLRWVQSSAAGFDHPVFGMLVDKGVSLSNSHAAAIAIAEFVLAGAFAHFQPDAPRLKAQADHQWQPLGFREVHGSTWLVLGVGHIGGEVAARAKALGAHVIGVRRKPRGDEPVHEMIGPELLSEHVARADVIVLSAASNTSSFHIIDERVLSATRRGSLLINVARGALVDEAALLAALDRGAPERAVLDVFETEPLPRESALWSHPSVRITAHCAALGNGLQARNDALFLDNLERFARGASPSHVVPPAVVKQSVPGNRDAK